MRTKSNIKRLDIINIARELFAVQGFERTSMSDIARKVGGSKATLYNYFSSKEELFLDILFLEFEEELVNLNSFLDLRNSDVKDALFNYGVSFLTFLYSPKILAMRRLILAESNRSHLGKLCFERGIKPSNIRLISFLNIAVQNGILKEHNTSVSACHLHGLLESELREYFLLGSTEPLNSDLILSYVHNALNVFLLAYGS